MTIFNPNNTVVVFDLDDTLYSEKDYVISGIHAISDFILNMLDVDIKVQLLEFYQAGGQDFIGQACSLVGLPNQAKQSLLWVYRLHLPAITPAPQAKNFIYQLNRHSVPVAIITDGRSISQRLKLKALGLMGIRAYISEDWGSEKPDLLRFKEVMNDYPNKQYIYIADNPSKDFHAPKQLGWKTFQLRQNENFVHTDNNSNVHTVYGDIYVSDFYELSQYFAWQIK